jgi:ArsR family transcriptional regulator
MAVNTSTVIASSPVELTAGLAALADPVRLRIVGVLAGGGRCVCDLQEKVPVAANLLSYHLRVLRDAGLVTAARRGRWIDYRLDGDGFAAVWAQASAAGVPLPGDRVITGRRGSPCEDDGEGCAVTDTRTGEFTGPSGQWPVMAQLPVLDLKPSGEDEAR